MYWTKMNMKKFDNLSININNNQKKSDSNASNTTVHCTRCFLLYCARFSVCVHYFSSILAFSWISVHQMMKHMMSKRLIALSANDKKKANLTPVFCFRLFLVLFVAYNLCAICCCHCYWIGVFVVVVMNCNWNSVFVLFLPIANFIILWFCFYFSVQNPNLVIMNNRELIETKKIKRRLYCGQF